MARASVVLVLLFVSLSCCSSSTTTGTERRGRGRIRSAFPDTANRLRGFDSSDTSRREAPQEDMNMQEIGQKLNRMRRQAGQPVINGDYSINDQNSRGLIHYSGSSSPVIILLTYSLTSSGAVRPNSSRLYRSTDYGTSFTRIDGSLTPPTQGPPSLWATIYISPVNKNLVVVFSYAQRNFMYYSLDEGATWTPQALPATLDTTSLLWSPTNDRAALAHDPTNDQLFVTQDLGRNWTKIADHVDLRQDYQWGDPNYDTDSTIVYFNTYDPNDHNRRNYTVSLYTQYSPYNTNTLQEFDPSLGRHDDFLLLGPYIYAQKTDPQGVISLYTSYNRGSFMQTKIPSSLPHVNYLVSHIDALQALVVIQHASGQFNLYLSDATAVYFSLSLASLTHLTYVLDLDIVDGVNGTLMANQYINGVSSGPSRSLISLDNGANWELVRPPTTGDCSPPQCSLHLHMRTTSYGRTAIYSQDSAPGLIMAHGNTGQTLSTNPDLYVSRDGGVSWSLTLQGSWGVTVVDHGGLLVAAKDYHQVPSTQLQYSCDEGLHWTPFTFSPTSVTVFGVITEPGEHTTTVSFYGVKRSSTSLSIITVNFSRVFERTCTGHDFYQWHPWDDRTDVNCILGSSVSIERRNVSVCCLIGRDYSRPTQFTKCRCTVDDFECDYGYRHVDEFSGECVRDSAVQLPPSVCDSGALTYAATRGYRKVAGDVCFSGVEDQLGPITRSCCVDRNSCQSSCVPKIAACVSSTAGYVCQCFPGYQGDGTVSGTGCTLFDQCSARSPCAPHSDCSWNNVTFTFSCACKYGYTGDALVTGTGCTNVNECSSKLAECVSSAYCEDTDGSYMCRCPRGYHGDGMKSGSGCSFPDVTGTPQSVSSSSSSRGLVVAVSLLSVLSCVLVCVIIVLMAVLIAGRRKIQGDVRRYEVVATNDSVDVGEPPSYTASTEQSMRMSDTAKDADDDPLLSP